MVCLAIYRAKVNLGKIRPVESEGPAGEEPLDIIGLMYKHEAHIKAKGYSLEATPTHKYRTEHSVEVVKAFWTWCELCLRCEQLCVFVLFLPNSTHCLNDD